MGFRRAVLWVRVRPPVGSGRGEPSLGATGQCHSYQRGNIVYHYLPLSGTRSILRVCWVVAGVAALSGCNPAGPGNVTVTPQENGQVVELQAGDVLDVLLPCDPSTGYKWDVVTIDAAVLEPQRGTTFVADSAAAGMTGVPGTITMSFAALRTGRTTLQLVYHRTFGFDTSPADAFEVTVVVNGG